MMYNIEQFLKEYSARVVENNQLVGKLAARGLGYEITQKVSSLSALMTVCYQKYETRPDIGFNTESDSYKNIKKLVEYLLAHECLYCNYKDTSKRKSAIVLEGKTNVEAFLYHLRNSLAHGGPGLNFFPIDAGGLDAITHIFLRDINKANIFVVKLSVQNAEREEECDLLRKDDLSVLIDAIPNLYIEREQSIRNHNNKLTKDYLKEIELLNELLTGGDCKVDQYFKNSMYLTKEEKNAYYNDRH